jgi:hypothetical protein
VYFSRDFLSLRENFFVWFFSDKAKESFAACCMWFLFGRNRFSNK